MWQRVCIYGSETYVLPGNVHVCVSVYAMEGVRGCVNVRAYMGV